MSNSTYEIMWRDAMGELEEQLNVEGVEDDEQGGGDGGAPAPKPSVGTLQHVKIYLID